MLIVGTRGKSRLKQHLRASWPTLPLWNAKPPIFWLLLWQQLRFPFSKIFFPYLSDPSGEIHLLALTPASSSKSGTRPAESRLTRIHTLTCTPAARKQTLTTGFFLFKDIFALVHRTVQSLNGAGEWANTQQRAGSKPNPRLLQEDSSNHGVPSGCILWNVQQLH